jgi:hypothetical protein
MSEVGETVAAAETSSAPESTPTPADTDLVARFVAPLSSVADAPVGEHAAVYQKVHATLQDALAEIDGR